VIAWNSYSQEERRAVLQRIDVLLGQIVARWLVIDDVELLGKQMQAQQINFDSARYPVSWVVELLKAGASQINTPEQYGLQLTEQGVGKNLRELRDAIEKEFYELSTAHYERYFKHAPL
jgi:hypothetical protein